MKTIMICDIPCKFEIIEGKKVIKVDIDNKKCMDFIKNWFDLSMQGKEVYKDFKYIGESGSGEFLRCILGNFKDKEGVGTSEIVFENYRKD